MKALFQQKDDQGRYGEGIVEVLTRAKNALETCDCRRLHQTEEDSEASWKVITEKDIEALGIKAAITQLPKS